MTARGHSASTTRRGERDAGRGHPHSILPTLDFFQVGRRPFRHRLQAAGVNAPGVTVQGEQRPLPERLVPEAAILAVGRDDKVLTADDTDLVELTRDHGRVRCAPPRTVSSPAAAARPATSSVATSARTRMGTRPAAASSTARAGSNTASPTATPGPAGTPTPSGRQPSGATSRTV